MKALLIVSLVLVTSCATVITSDHRQIAADNGWTEDELIAEIKADNKLPCSERKYTGVSSCMVEPITQTGSSIALCRYSTRIKRRKINPGVICQ